MMITTLDEFERLLKLLKDSGVQVFKSGDLQLVMFDSVYEESEEDEDEMDTKSGIGFETTDLRGMGISTDFDE